MDKVSLDEFPDLKPGDKVVYYCQRGRTEAEVRTTPDASGWIDVRRTNNGGGWVRIHSTWCLNA